MNDLNDILESCLQEIEKGTDIETVLSRYPKYAEELRPILESSVQAIRLATLGPSPEVERRGRTKVLQHAAQMREARVKPSRRNWSVPLRRVLVTLAVIGVLFMGTNRLVHAASGTLPGDNLYPVKRTWEDLRVLFTFNTQAREALEVEHENERLSELNELFAEGRSVEVEFAGTVKSQNGNQWVIAKFPVLISNNTELGPQPVKVGDAVRVKGFTQPDGTVLAGRVELLPAGIPLPSVEEQESGTEQETPEDQNEDREKNSSGPSEDQGPEIEKTKKPEDETSFDGSSLDGVVDSVNGTTLVVNGQSLNISGAEINGTPKTGSVAKVEGYLDANGGFVVTKVEFQNGGSDDGASSSGESKNSGSEDKSGSENGGSNDSGGSDSGSGGGGND